MPSQTIPTKNRTDAATSRFLAGFEPCYLTDGGLETTLVFHHGIDLPDFAAFPLLDSAEGREELGRYYGPYLDIAQSRRTGIVLDTPTWRANPDWAARLGYDREALAGANRRAVAYIEGLATERSGVDAVLNGVIGPRGDGYAVGETMSTAEAARYHSLQVRAFVDAGTDIVTAVTMTYVDEAIGITRAAIDVDIPVVIGFTVETDGRLPSGMALGEAIETVDEATGNGPAWYMVNCAHPSHFADVFVAGRPWLGRIQAVRANASRMSHAELDEAPELDRGDPVELAADYVALRSALPELRVVGGCCGTDHQHIAEIVNALG
ncbi:MAG: homocysteine S-methyltransferase family protein [Acidimicrobiales bacterium]